MDTDKTKAAGDNLAYFDDEATGKRGYRDSKTGATVIEPIYDFVGGFSEGLSNATLRNEK
jgi:hypothetical protein